ncbi:MAG TPA: hypothetical protein VEH04_08235 [Verrucomicrobiae bacterium]|nr:hypothetical protein [Verrucomicrobiae bacterium]
MDNKETTFNATDAHYLQRVKKIMVRHKVTSFCVRPESSGQIWVHLMGSDEWRGCAFECKLFEAFNGKRLEMTLRDGRVLLAAYPRSGKYTDSVSRLKEVVNAH